MGNEWTMHITIPSDKYNRILVELDDEDLAPAKDEHAGQHRHLIYDDASRGQEALDIVTKWLDDDEFSTDL